MNEPAQPGLFIGIDWADQKHDCYVIDRDGKRRCLSTETVTSPDSNNAVRRLVDTQPKKTDQLKF
jgi:hypothetical protein